MTLAEWLPIMATLACGAGLKEPPSQIQIEVYFDILKDLPVDAVKRAARQALAESQYPTLPPVGVLRRLAGAGAIEVESRALVAYGHAARAVQTVGGYGSIDFSDPLVNAVIRDLGGWIRFCDWPVDEVQWRKRDFIQQYEALEQCGVSGELCAPLTGICGIENSSGGYLEYVPASERIECGLPDHRSGLIRGPVPDVQKTLGAAQKRISQAVEAVAVSHGIAETSAKFSQRQPVVERPPLTDEEFEALKAARVAESRHRIAVRNSTVDQLIDAGGVSA